MDNHAEIAMAHLAKRDEAMEKVRGFTAEGEKRALTPAERDAEARYLKEVAEADEHVRNHLAAAADQERVSRAKGIRVAEQSTKRGSNVDDGITPGGLLHRSVEPSRGITTTGTGKAFSPEEMSSRFIDLLAPVSVVMASGVQRVTTGAETYSFPVVRSDFTAAFVGELEDLPSGGFGAEPLKVKPVKLAASDLIANELVMDGGSAFLNPMAKSLLRSVALGFDKQALTGDGTGKGSVGIGKTPGIQVHAVTGGLKNLDPFVSAFGLLEGVSASASAVVMNPATWTTLMGLKEATGSLKPLLAESAGSPTGSVRRSILGVPVWLSPFQPAAEVLAYDASEVFAVWRSDAAFEVSQTFGFLKDGQAVRAIARAAVAVPNPAAVCRITIAN